MWFSSLYPARTAELFYKGRWREIDFFEVEIDDVVRIRETDGTLFPDIYRVTRRAYFDPVFGCKAIQGKPTDLISLGIKSIRVSGEEFEFLKRIVT